jgi:hypothetical protein
MGNVRVLTPLRGRLLVMWLLVYLAMALLDGAVLIAVVKGI